MTTGKFLLVEGCDGGGKTTLTKMLVAALEATGQRVHHLSFPGRVSAIGKLIRDSFEGKATINSDAMLWLFVAEAKDMAPQIEEHLSNGDWIVCDRHAQVSSLVYQAEVHGLTAVDSVISPAHLRLPDRLYLIDVPAEVALERRAKRGEARNVLYEPEQADRLNLMRTRYRDLEDVFPMSVILDGTLPLDENLKNILRDLGLSQK